MFAITENRIQLCSRFQTANCLDKHVLNTTQTLNPFIKASKHRCIINGTIEKPDECFRWKIERKRTRRDSGRKLKFDLGTRNVWGRIESLALDHRRRGSREKSWNGYRDQFAFGHEDEKILHNLNALKLLICWFIISTHARENFGVIIDNVP